MRCYFPTDAKVHVDPVLGSDSNDGFLPGAGAMQHLQPAISRMQNDFDFRGKVAEIQLADGIYAEQVIAFGAPVGTPQILVTGNPASPGNVLWRVPTGGTCLKVRDGGIVTLSGVKMEATGPGATLLNPSQAGILDVLNVEFGDAPSGYHVIVNNGGKLNVVEGSYTLSGDCMDHILAMGPCAVDFVTSHVSIPAPVSFTRFVYAAYNAVVTFPIPITFSGAGAGNGSPGAKYLSANGSDINLGGNTLPGAILGGKVNGGRAS